jgi:hypothetical protein
MSPLATMVITTTATATTRVRTRAVPRNQQQSQQQHQSQRRPLFRVGSITKRLPQRDLHHPTAAHTHPHPTAPKLNNCTLWLPKTCASNYNHVHTPSSKNFQEAASVEAVSDRDRYRPVWSGTCNLGNTSFLNASPSV